MSANRPLWSTHLSPVDTDFRGGYHDKPRSEILPLIDWTPQRVLDIGCGGGATGRLLATRFEGCALFGVERDLAAASRAARHYRQVIQADLDRQPLVSLGLPLASFDTVLLLDVLEHLVNPWQLLASLAQALTPGARLLISLPNMANIEALHALAAGRWPYAADGLFDITHLRFFTHEGMHAMLADAGLVLQRQVALPHPASRLPAGVTVGTDHVETDKVVVKGLTGPQAANLFAIQRLLLAQVEDQAAPAGASTPPPAESAPLLPAVEALAVPAAAGHASASQRLRDAYLDMVRRSVLGLIHEDPALAPQGQQRPFDPDARDQGLDWPATAQSMIGHRRMFNLQCLAEQVIVDRIPGDLIETGVWRGGACILMRAVLQAYDVRDRRVWVADSFAGLPPPTPERYPQDAGDTHHQQAALAVPLAEVQRNFARYGLLDGQVCFLPGWFKDTLAASDTGPLALMRLDGDMYESTMDALTALFPRLSPGGFVIIDDYGYIASCRAAVDNYRAQHGITDPLVWIDRFGVYWRNQQPHAGRPAAWAPPHRSVEDLAGLPDRLQRRPGSADGLLPLMVENVAQAYRAETGEWLVGHHVATPIAGQRWDSGTLRVAGWVIGRAAPAVAAHLCRDGQSLQRTPVNLPRPDVAKVHAGGERSGFVLNLVRSGAVGAGRCEVVVELADGQRVVLARFDLVTPASGSST